MSNDLKLKIIKFVDEIKSNKVVYTYFEKSMSITNSLYNNGLIDEYEHKKSIKELKIFSKIFGSKEKIDYFCKTEKNKLFKNIKFDNYYDGKVRSL